MVLKDIPPGQVIEDGLGLLWDDRVKQYRAPGCYFDEIKKWIKKSNLEVKEQVLSIDAKPLSGNFRSRILRPYQETAVELWKNSNSQGIVVLPTGAGKTQLALSVINRSQSRTLCLVPTRALLDQWHQEIKKIYDGPIGIQGDGIHTIEAITVSTYESAYRNISELGNRFDLIIIDECHHFGRGMRDEILKMCVAPMRLGLTATPPTDPEWVQSLEELIGPLVFQLTLGDLTGTYLADYDYYTLHVDLNKEERYLYDLEIQVYRKVYSDFRAACPEGQYLDWIRFAARSEEGRKALQSFQRAKKILTNSEAKANLLNTLIARHWGKKLLIFTADTEMSYRISREHLIMPITADIGRKEREEMLQAFRQGKIKAIVSCRVLNEGLDVPDAEVAIITGGTQGVREHVQRIGRILRPNQGKRALIYELVCRNTIEVRQSMKRSYPIASSSRSSL